ncbi:isocitrate dehydrogenase [Deinococcus aerius]|uniref:Isocitrate dehydrogenase [NADP] n=1 Tax=Deinococcus aerius TaxID=200253 RepID=A0A2I9DRC7_9DEIO|nr:NADP-dependent isocitrate dehydrogenase [Deinococcus aerius]GBF07931.1 isocitrate dehydrogenase [Deinococcus aerius]
MNTTVSQPQNADAPHSTLTPIAVAPGDGIGPEIMGATLRVLEAAGARIEPHPVEVGKEVYLRGVNSGVAPEAWEAMRRTGVLLKGPITTPQGGGYKSVNVTLRKALGLYANVRPARAYAPFVATHHPGMDLVIVRENEEDLYAGIEHRQTDEVYQCLKLVTRDGCERVIRYAFEYARAHSRRKVTAMSKDNIMKLTDGLFHRVFDEVAREYADIAADHMIVDIGAARLGARPESFDVIVTLNLYGDILSDIASEVAGSVGLGGSANIGGSVALFEAVHGSAPDIAGQDKANPSGLLNAAALMLTHIGQGDVAARVLNAWLRTLEDGVHTADIAGEHTTQQVGTQAFAQAVIDRLGQMPQRLPAVSGEAASQIQVQLKPRTRAEKVLVGTDVFLDWQEAGRQPDVLGAQLQKAEGTDWKLDMISNRGVKVWPQGLPETTCSDHWRCRFLWQGARPLTHADVLSLLARVSEVGLDFVKTEHLYTFDGQLGYTAGQGQ